ncbi:MAG TPA: tetratricopeptide repeat protein [Fimbriiglobus sp.]|jgi:tetratricopeptide (TPR) repeat protein|nr:tetratricopeptide repeat protein [Fimbriiglobus sp.]
MNTTYMATALCGGFLLVAAAGDSAAESIKKGKAALVAGKAEDAIRHLTDAIRADPKNAEAHYHRARAFQLATRMGEAMADLSEAIKLDPKFTKAYVERGTLYLAQSILPDGKSALPKAVADLTEASRLAPRDAGPLYHRALARYEAGEYAEAIADLDRAIRLESEEPALHLDLARVLAVCPEAKYRDGRRAVKAATKACELTGWKEPLALESLAAGYAEAGKFGDAVKWQRRAVEVLTVGGFDAFKKRAEVRLREYERGKPVRYRSLLRWY